MSSPPERSEAGALPASPGVRSTALGHLEALVAFDTRNPPRTSDGFGVLFRYVKNALAPYGFDVVTRELGDGCSWLLASRGDASASRVLVNVHVDTVPADPAWASNGNDPLALRVVDEDGQRRAIGLGACDTKGALACFLEAAAQTRGPVQLLLTTDEEAGNSTCVNTFASEHAEHIRGRRVLIAEPTGARAVLAHRGIATCSGVFTGVGGHASHPRALVDSAVHAASRWAAKALERAAHDDIRFNLGRIEGGTKANMIAAECSVRFGVRPLLDPARVVEELCALANPKRTSWTPGYLAPSLAATDASRAFAKDIGVDEGEAVDFFTEAALFAQAGAIAVVLGAGDIAQAHTAGEFVPVRDLEKLTSIYARVLGAAS